MKKEHHEAYVYQPHPINHEPSDRLWAVGGVHESAELSGLTIDEAKVICEAINKMRHSVY